MSYLLPRDSYLLLNGFIWDMSIIASHILVPIIFYNVGINKTASLGLLIALVGIIISKIGIINS